MYANQEGHPILFALVEAYLKASFMHCFDKTLIQVCRRFNMNFICIFFRVEQQKFGHMIKVTPMPIYGIYRT